MKNIAQPILALSKKSYILVFETIIVLGLVWSLKKKYKPNDFQTKYSIIMASQRSVLILSSIKLTNTEKYVNVNWVWISIPSNMLILDSKSGFPLGNSKCEAVTVKNL